MTRKLKRSSMSGAEKRKGRASEPEVKLTWRHVAWRSLADLAIAPPVIPPRPVFVSSHAGSWSAAPAVSQLEPEQQAVLELLPADDLRQTTGQPRPPGPTVAAGPTGNVDVVVRVLGPLEVTGWAEPPTRGKVTELLVYLATHPGRPVPAERLRTSVWPYDPERADVALATVHQEISRLRRCLGPQRFPEARGGYQLAESVVCDWARFEALVEAARALPELPGTDVLAEALALVRGEPFQDVGAKSYSWAFEEVLVARIEAAVSDAAHLMAQRCLGAGRLIDANWAVRQGLLANPRDEMMHTDALALAAAGEGRAGLDRAWREVQRVMGPQDQRSALLATYQRLRSR
jgi:DNA-binding SARP family transcriptional activator